MQHYESIIPKKFTINNVGLTFSVGDTILWLTISIKHNHQKLITPLNVIFCVVIWYVWSIWSPLSISFMCFTRKWISMVLAMKVEGYGVRWTHRIWLLILYGHLYLDDVWIGVNLRMDTKKICVYKRLHHVLKIC